jgi:hypothetical protein
MFSSSLLSPDWGLPRSANPSLPPFHQQRCRSLAARCALVLTVSILLRFSHRRRQDPPSSCRQSGASRRTGRKERRSTGHSLLPRRRRSAAEGTGERGQPAPYIAGAAVLTHAGSQCLSASLSAERVLCNALKAEPTGKPFDDDRTTVPWTVLNRSAARRVGTTSSPLLRTTGNRSRRKRRCDTSGRSPPTNYMINRKKESQICCRCRSRRCVLLQLSLDSNADKGPTTYSQLYG